MLLSIGAERVSDAALNPLPTVPSTFSERMEAEWENQRFTYGTGSGARSLHQQYEVARERLRQAGFDAPNPVDYDATALGGIMRSTYGRDLAARDYAAAVEAARRQHPDRAAEFLMPDEVQRAADDAARAARQRAGVMEQVGGGGAGAFLAQAGAAIIDPGNALTMPLGGAVRLTGGLASRILMTGLIEGGIAGGTQIGIDLNPFGAGGAWERRRLGLPMDVGANAFEAALGGAVIGGGTRGLVEGWRAFRGVNPAADGGLALREADAATVLEAQQRAMAGNPAGPEGAEMHLDLLDRATEAVAAGRVAPEGMPVREAFARALRDPDVEAASPGAFRIHTPAGRSIQAEAQVVELRDLIPSHTDDLTPNPAYPHAEGVQPRDRSRDASAEQVRSIAANLEPERLRGSPEAGTGAPIIDAENVVESGNGRVLALRQAYADPALADRAAAYRAMLEAQGFDTAGMSQPVLISRRLSALTPDERRAFVREANSATALTMGAAERARLDADLAGRALDLYRGGDIALADNAPFVRAFMQGVPQAERGAMTAADGTLSGEGARRIRGAVLARAYGDEMGPLLERILEGEAEGLRGIAGALQDVSGPWAAMRAAAARGELAPGMDVTADLLAAVRTVTLAREKRIPVADMLAQTDLDAPPLTDAGRALLASFYRDPGFRSAAGRTSMSERLAGYIDEAMKTRPEPDLFGAAPPAAREVLDATDPMRGRQVAATDAGRRIAEVQAEPKAPDADFLEAQRIAATRDLAIPVDDAGNTRGLRELLDEAEDAVADAAGAAACFVGATVSAAA